MLLRELEFLQNEIDSMTWNDNDILPANNLSNNQSNDEDSVCYEGESAESHISQQEETEESCRIQLLLNHELIRNWNSFVEQSFSQVYDITDDDEYHEEVPSIGFNEQENEYSVSSNSP